MSRLSSSKEAEVLTFAESASFSNPRTGRGSFGAHASCWSPSSKNSDRIIHAEAGNKPSHMKPYDSALTKRTCGLDPEHVSQTIDLLQVSHVVNGQHSVSMHCLIL